MSYIGGHCCSLESYYKLFYAKILDKMVILSLIHCYDPGVEIHSKKKINLFHFMSKACLLTHWGRMMHICVGNLTIIGSDNGLSPGRRQAIIWTNAGTLLIRPLGTNFSETLIEIHTFSFKKIHLKMSSGKCRPFCLGLSVLMSLCVGPCFLLAQSVCPQPLLWGTHSV